MHLMNVLIKIFNRKKYSNNIIDYNFFYTKWHDFFKINKHNKQISNYIFNDIVLNTHKS